jgi:hypothetical protein
MTVCLASATMGGTTLRKMNEIGIVCHFIDNNNDNNDII